MTTLTPDLASALAHITAAIDAGDDSVLLILADVLEEMGDPRAAGLRLVGDRAPVAVYESDLAPGQFRWFQISEGGSYTLRSLPVAVYERLRHSTVWNCDEGWSNYPTRSAAILALAAALTAE